MSLQQSGTPGRPVRDGDLDLPAEVPEAGVNEIVVHGVGGATPESMLDVPAVQQVTGDRISGMWRGPDREVDGESRWHREAYSWGGLTSRAFTGALWLFFAPFALVNLAGWMALGKRFTGQGRPDWRIAFQQALVRMIALAATWTYVLFVAQISMDLGAWQCTTISRCRIGDWPTVIPLPVAGYPAREVMLASLVPVLFVLGLYVLTRVSVRRYEAFTATVGRTGMVDLPRARLTDPQFWSGSAYANMSRWLHLISSTVLVAALLTAVAQRGGRFGSAGVVLNDTALAVLGIALVCAGWQNARVFLLGSVRRVWACALFSTGLLGAAAVLAWLQPPSPVADPATADPGIMPGIREGFSGLVVAVYAVGLLHGVVAAFGRRALGRDPVRPPWMPTPFTTLAVGAWLLFAVWVGTVMWAARWLSPSAKPAIGTTAGHLVYSAAYPALAQLSLVGIGIVLVIVLCFVVWCRYRRRPSVDEERRYWDGLTLSGEHLRATQGAGHDPAGGAPETPADVAAQAPTRWLTGVRRTRWWTTNTVPWLETGLAWAAGIATIGAVGFTGWIGERWLRLAGLAQVSAAVVVACSGLTVLSWLSIRTSRPESEAGAARRTLAQRAQLLAGWLVFVAAAAGAVALSTPVMRRFDQRPPVGDLTGWWVPREAFASTVLTLIPVASVLLVRQAIRSPGTRRLVAVAWDIATFWPRAFHPLAPPSYGERAVPELHLRARHLLDGGNSVLMLGHSQGAVLVTAALARLHDLPAQARRRLAVVTYGNPLRRLYMRWFPGYVNPELVADLLAADDADDGGTAGPRLVNFFRHTDPIGSWLGHGSTAGPVPDSTDVPAWNGDCWLPDPPTDLYRPGNSPPYTRGHANEGYVRQSTFTDHVDDEVRRLSGLARGPG